MLSRVNDGDKEEHSKYFTWHYVIEKMGYLHGLGGNTTLGFSETNLHWCRSHFKIGGEQNRQAQRYSR